MAFPTNSMLLKSVFLVTIYSIKPIHALILLDVQFSKHRPIPSRDISESYIELPTVNNDGNSRPPSLYSSSSLEQKGHTSRDRNQYVEESGSDGLSVNSSDSRLSRGSGNSLGSYSRDIDIRQNGKQYIQDHHRLQMNMEHILQSYRSPPSYANRVGLQRGHSQNSADRYRHPPPYREMRNSMGFHGVKPIMYSRSENVLNRPLSGPPTGSYPDIRVVEGVGLRQFGQKMPANRQLRNSKLFRKVDQATMTDDAADESDSSSQDLGFPMQMYGSPHPASQERMLYSNPYEAFSGLSFSAYTEPYLNDSRMYNKFNQSPSSQGMMMSSPPGSGLYSQVNGDVQMYASYEGPQWPGSPLQGSPVGLDPNKPGD